MGVEAPQNFSLGELGLSGQVLARNSPLVVRTDLAHIGLAGGRTVEIHVLDEVGRPQMRSQTEVELGADESHPLSFTLSGLDERISCGASSLSSCVNSTGATRADEMPNARSGRNASFDSRCGSLTRNALT